MLRKALNVHWSERMPNVTLYGNLPKISDKIAARRLRLAGHCQRHPELGVDRLILRLFCLGGCNMNTKDGINKNVHIINC